MRPGPRTKTNDFVSFVCFDCDGNPIAAPGEPHERFDDSDTAYLNAVRIVRQVWVTFEVGQICGVLANGTTIPLMRFYRAGPKRDKGPPGGRTTVCFELEDFPFVTWTEEG
jgi:hypothetical protein